jgi:hypothetical protein
VRASLGTEPPPPGRRRWAAAAGLPPLGVGRRWAAKAGDTALIPQIDRWLEAAEKRMEADLRNGRYYRAYGSASGPVNVFSRK